MPMLQTDRSKQTLTIQGKTFFPSDFRSATSSVDWLGESTPILGDLARFLNDWFDSSEEITIHTSGSTGIPNALSVQKKYMMESACITCRFFGLQPLEKALLCLPMGFIAGKMMVVRALVGGLDLYPVSPSGHPLNETDGLFRFAAMVPLQVYNSLQKPIERKRLQEIDTLLIGGSAIDPDLEKELRIFKNSVYASYGMAETLSHIALRKLNGNNASLYFTPLPSVSLSLTEENTLIVHAPRIYSKKLFTNDLAEIRPDGSFRILGRKDNTIITGGIKVQTEELEAKLSCLIPTPFAITSHPNIQFGEIVVLVTEKPMDISLLKKHLAPHEVPKKMLFIEKIPRTESGKIDRAALKRFAQEQS